MTQKYLLWIGFHLFVLAMLALDLGVFHRKHHAIRTREALIWSAVWIALALIFNLGISALFGPQRGIEFLTGYVVEKSLSIDNIFIFLLIFSYFKVPAIYQHKVLFFGILGALLMRALFIAVGITLLAKFQWVIYVFGAFLILTGLKMAFEKEKHKSPDRNPVIKLLKKIMPITSEYVDGRFFVKLKSGLAATPLFVALLVVETSDVIFAVDSIPAVLAVTRDPFIVYTSNVFAILGLRSLYFAVASAMASFRYMKFGLSAILVFVGLKMTLSEHYQIPAPHSLAVIFGILLATVLFSIFKKHEHQA